MSKTDINQGKFSVETLLKLEIFRDYFREWFPVFVYGSFPKLYVFDLFAGSGTDSTGSKGSPLLLLEEAMIDSGKYCQQLATAQRQISFFFNEKLQKKTEELNENVTKLLSSCPQRGQDGKCGLILDECILRKNTSLSSQDFSDIINNEYFTNILNDTNSSKFILLDQYGYSKITENVVSKLANSPTTDFIFFISSSFVNRFRNQKAVTDHLNTQEMIFKGFRMSHRVVAMHFKKILPTGIEYYMHHFTIKNGSNYYGLIFGTRHTLGMEKFLKVCWDKDKAAGESNCNITDDIVGLPLWSGKDEGDPIKVRKAKKVIQNKILNRTITNNIDGMKEAMRLGCLPKVYVEVIVELKKNNLVLIDGKFNQQAQKIHKVSKYEIILP